MQDNTIEDEYRINFNWNPDGKPGSYSEFKNLAQVLAWIQAMNNGTDPLITVQSVERCVVTRTPWEQVPIPGQ